VILEAILTVVKVLLQFIFALLPDIPNFEVGLLESLNTYIGYIFNHLELLGFFVRISTIKTLIPLVIIVVNFEHVYHFALWVIKKLPFGMS